MSTPDLLTFFQVEECVQVADNPLLRWMTRAIQNMYMSTLDLYYKAEKLSPAFIFLLPQPVNESLFQ